MKTIPLLLFAAISAVSFRSAFGYEDLPSFSGRYDLPRSEAAGLQQCVDHCGNGICEEIVCMGLNCPCSENSRNCPQDCPAK